METPTRPRKRIRKNPNQSNPDLSIDLQLEIVSFLPVKSVLRFRSVCKLWNFETRQNRFVDQHLLRQKSHQNQTFAFHMRGAGAISTINIYDLKSAGMIPQPLIPADPFPLDEFWISSSCNGLLCLVARGSVGRICLTNPANHDYVLLPKLNCSSCYDYALGYDSIAKEYKVIAVVSDVLLVCSVSLGEWRVVGGIPQHGMIRNTWVFLEGRLHYLVHHDKRKDAVAGDSRWAYSIMSFDLHDEKLRELQLSNKIKERVRKAEARKLRWNMSLMVLNGRLAIFMSLQGHWTVSLWIMEEYGKEESWIRIALFRYSKELKRSKRYPQPSCVLYLKDDKKILLCYDNKIFSYDMKKRKCIELKQESDNVSPYYEYQSCFPFVSSLVTLKDARKDWDNIRTPRI